MELTYRELAKKEVINITDGRSLGKITDLKLRFPQGVLSGIFVPARKNRGLFWFFDKSTLFIDVSRIVKIGGDVILVNVNCGDNCSPNTNLNNKPPGHACPPNCPPPCPPKCPPNLPPKSSGQEGLDLSSMFDENGRINLDDY